jgi:hypothetical protein
MVLVYFKEQSKLQTEQSTPANIIFDTQTDIIESVQETVLINDEDFDIIHNDSDIEIGHNVDTSSVQCGPSTLSPLTNTEITLTE